MFKKIDLSVFPSEREQRLKEIYRFNAFDVLLYRSNLWMHSRRVLWLVEELLPLAQKYFEIDTEKTRILALVHDDAEMITGDIPAHEKNKMSEKETAEMECSEENAINFLTEKYPKSIHEYVYKDLLMHALKKDCIEAQLVSYADKLDAQCESIHEVLAGNISLLRSIFFYNNAFAAFPQKFPDLAPLLNDQTSSLTFLINTSSRSRVEIKNYTEFNKPFTKDSLETETDFPFYNTWRKIVIEKGSNEGLEWLLKQEEYLPV